MKHIARTIIVSSAMIALAWYIAHTELRAYQLNKRIDEMQASTAEMFDEIQAPCDRVDFVILEEER